MAYFGLTIFFAGFNFLEAGLPAKLSILADEKYRGASLGVFSSFQFLGTFCGGLIGGLLLIEDKPENVFICTLIITAIWIFYHKYFSNLEN
jgi:MFS family permease